MDCAAEAADDARRAYHGAPERQQRIRLRRPPDVRPVELGIAGGLCLGQRDPHPKVRCKARRAGRRAAAAAAAGARLRGGDERSEARHRRRRRRRAPLKESRDWRGGECRGGGGRQLRDREVRARAVGVAEAHLRRGREPARRQRYPSGAAQLAHPRRHAKVVHGGTRLRGRQVEQPSPRRHLRGHGHPAAAAAAAAAIVAVAAVLLLLLLLLLLLPARASRAASGGGGFSGRVALDRARERGARGGGGVLGGVNAQPGEQLAEGGRRLARGCGTAIAVACRALGRRVRRRHRRCRLLQQACRRFREAGVEHERLLVVQRAQAVRQSHRLGAAAQHEPRRSLAARQRRGAHGHG